MVPMLRLGYRCHYTSWQVLGSAVCVKVPEVSQANGPEQLAWASQSEFWVQGSPIDLQQVSVSLVSHLPVQHSSSLSHSDPHAEHAAHALGAQFNRKKSVWVLARKITWVLAWDFPTLRNCSRTGSLQVVVDLGWVDFDFNVPPCCPAAQPFQPNSHLPKHSQAGSGMTLN